MKKDITELFCLVDEFCKVYKKLEGLNQLPCSRQRCREGQMTLSELMTVMIFFHNSPFKNFKHYYLYYIRTFYKGEFPSIVSYSRFVQLMPRLFLPLTILLHALLGRKDGIYYLDSTSLAVCHPKRIQRHRVFESLAKRGRTSMGWFYGFKIHAVINARGEFVALKITAGNVDDRHPIVDLTKDLTGHIFADKGYIDHKLFKKLYAQGLKLVTGLRKNMTNKLISLEEKLLLRKRFIIETVFDYLKNKLNLEHSRHRSPLNAFVHILSTLVAYSLKKTKPSITPTSPYAFHPSLIQN